jgi:hypothetical protein
MKKRLLICVLIVSSFSVFAQVDLNKGLMLHLPFKGNTLDASPNGNHATNYGAALTADQWGNPNSAYQFNGTSSYMRIPNASTLQCDTQITLCARVKVMGFYKGLCFGNNIIQKGDADFKLGGYGLRFSSPIGECSFFDSSSQNYMGFINAAYPSSPTFNTTPYIIKENWDCLVYVYDGTNAKMYVNGVLRFSYPSTSLIGKNLDDLFIGHLNSATFPYWFNGIMDEVRIYNRALNTLEIDSVCSKSNPEQTAIREVKESEALPILSNPVSSELILGLDNNSMGGTLNITDMSGRRLIQVRDLRNNTISVENLAAGIYLVTYQLENTLMHIKMQKQ